MNELKHALARIVIALCFLGVLSGVMQAEVGLMLNEALRVGASKWTGAGHSAVYLSGVCMVSPVELRLCEPGENGIVLSNYQAFGEDHSYEWNAIPLNIFLYGVEDEANRPVYASSTVRWMLQERYRTKYLSTVCTGSCATNPNAQWRQMVASLFLRDIYMFTVKTTREQDQALVDKFNHAPNVGHYNGFTYNCADFAREVVNTYFPRAARADHLNDFWMTSPKAISKSFSHYAIKHPDLNFYVVRFSQVPGEYASSKDNRKGTEQLYRSNRWRVPLAFLRPHELIVFASSYIISGRFNPELELQRRPSAEVISYETGLKEARRDGNSEEEQQWNQKIRHARANSLGTSEEWQGYDTVVRQYEDEAVEMGYVSNVQSLRNMARDTLAHSWITMDPNGGLWLVARDGRSHPRVGLSASTLLLDTSEARTGYLIALSRIDSELHKQIKNRETLVFFRKDWELMEQLRDRAFAPHIPYLAGTQRTQGGAAPHAAAGAAQ